MNPATRYANFVEGVQGRLREDVIPRGTLSELEIQAHWFAGDFGTEFTSTHGDKITVIQFGVWNRGPGPDFSEAAISINNGPPVRGSIEIDPDAGDWERHGHATNPEYDEVILHVCGPQDDKQFFARTTAHREVPCVTIDPGKLHDNPAQPQPLAKLGRCSAPLADLTPEALRELLEAAARYRLSKKSSRLSRIGALHGDNEALYQAIASTLGYKNNKFPFTIIAQRLPLKFLQQHHTDLDALLFGIAGFLEAADFSQFDLETRKYLRSLWDRWWKLRDQFTRLILPPGTWRLNSTRPANHPQRRLAALGQIVRGWAKIQALVGEGNLEGIADFLESLSDEYWDTHFTLISKKSRAPMALTGHTRVADMLANVFYPLVIGSGRDCWEDYAKLHSPLVSGRVNIAATRLLSHPDTRKAVLKNMVNQQGLLQIYEDFCMRDNSDCAQCLFPGQVAQWA